MADATTTDAPRREEAPTTPEPGTPAEAEAAPPQSFDELLLTEEREEAAALETEEAPEEHDPPPAGEDFDEEDVEVEAERDQEDLDEEYEDESEEQAPGELHSVTVDGEELQVPYDELVAGYSRQADYTRKTQRLAQAFKELEGRQQAVQQERAQYATLLNRLRQTWQQSLQGDEPDWERLKEEDPVGYSIKREEWRERQEKIQAAEQELARVQSQQQQEAQQARAVRLAQSQQALQQAVPEWQDPEKAQKEKAELAQFAIEEYGFSEEELREVDDHRPILLLRDAYLGRKARKKAEKLRRTGKSGSDAPTTRPGSASSRGSKKRSRAYKEARKNLRQRGSTDAAVDAMEHLLAREE